MKEALKHIPPAGYKTSHGGLIVAVIFGLWTAFLTAMALMSDSDIIEILPFIIVSAGFVIGAVISDVTTNSKVKKRIANRNEMLKGECVKGEIVELSQRPYILGRELDPAKLKKTMDGYVYNYKAKNRAYRLIVKYTDPVDNTEKMVTSELYHWFQLHEFDKEAFRNRKKDLVPLCIRDDCANVYVAENGSAWVEVIPK